MRNARFQDAPCPIARSTDLLGDPWIPMILRECTYGVARFDDFQRRLNIAPNTLTARLQRMVEQGLLEKVPYEERPLRYAYRLTPMGRGATVILAAMIQFGDEWIFEKGRAPVVLRSRRTGEVVQPVLVDAATGERVDPADVVPAAGPGFPGDAAFQRAWFEPAPPAPRTARAESDPDA